MQNTTEPIIALGLMSGTSLDGVDAALIETDGEHVHGFGPWLTLPYADAFRQRLRHAMMGREDIPGLERELTLRHAEAVHTLLLRAGMAPCEVRLIGFHGQTVVHRPTEGITWQIGDGALLAAQTGIDVVCDFRRADMAAGGQGAPLVPVFHAALAEMLPKPAAVLNIGGLANVTYIGPDYSKNNGGIIAFDTGPGCAILNDTVHRATGAEYDKDGALARSGTVDAALLARFLADPYFVLPPHKSLDRGHFRSDIAAHLPLPDALATLTACVAGSVAAAIQHFPEAPVGWHVCGGGRHNAALMQALSDLLPDVHGVDALGWAGDALEAQAFAYLAVRSLRGLPLTLPSTTGVAAPVSGGALYRAPSLRA